MDVMVYYIIGAISFAIVSLAQGYVKRNYNKYSKVDSKGNITGAEIARKILKANGLDKVYVVETQGVLTDHYDPSRKVVRLSSSNYNDTSIAAVAVAAHECGHALQDKDNYFLLRLRAALVPIVNISNKAGYIIIMIGVAANIFNLVILGIMLLGAILLFHLVTLPVEINASKRAMEKIEKMHLLTGDEVGKGRSMLIAAALTYVASVLSSLLEIFRLLLVYGNRDE